MSDDLELTLVPRDLFYVERRLVAEQAAEIIRLRARADALDAEAIAIRKWQDRTSQDRRDALDRSKILEDALRPFAAWAKQLDGHYTTQLYPDTCSMMLCPDTPNRSPSVGDLRRARTALEGDGKS